MSAAERFRNEAASLREAAKMALADPPDDTACAVYTLTAALYDIASEMVPTPSTPESIRSFHRETVAETIIALGLATGHGDTAEDMIAEARAHIDDLIAKAREEGPKP